MTNENLLHNVINWTEVDPHKMTLSMKGKSQRSCVIVFAYDSCMSKLPLWRSSQTLRRWTAHSGGNTALTTSVSAGSNRWNTHIVGSILTFSCEAVAMVCQLWQSYTFFWNTHEVLPSLVLLQCSCWPVVQQGSIPYLLQVSQRPSVAACPEILWRAAEDCLSFTSPLHLLLVRATLTFGMLFM